MSNILDCIKTGVIFGEDINTLFKIAKKKNFAIPAINCSNIDIINIVLATAEKFKSPIIIQLSYGGSAFICGNDTKNLSETKKSILGAISAAQHVHTIAKYYKIPIILHTDHCHKKILPWIDHLLEISEKNFQKIGKPIFSSHMIDLSQENIKENIKICSNYLKKMKKINMILEIELGCTGGEEDGISNSLHSHTLYTTPKDVNYAYEKLKKISSNFMIAASFGNVHGVYRPGNIHLKPKILQKTQKYIQNKHKLLSINPINFVFHGGSGSSISEIQQSINYGVVKINVDTDIQWKYWEGILKYYKNNQEYLQKQIGNPKGIDQPNKKYYDPRSWIQSAKNSVSVAMEQIFKTFNSHHLW
ncbi:class II fructose-bisphosphate aldolase [Buchnera aphidicola]|uniref:class II fructose-bisphosphate aldolase n=1 Tax=Buchnera aphidicola TaxID=9 RepID=UPI0034639B8A